MNSGIAAVLTISWLTFFILLPSSLSISIGEDDYTSNFTTVASGGEYASASDTSGPSIVSQFGYGIMEQGDIQGELGFMHLLGVNDPPHNLP